MDGAEILKARVAQLEEELGNTKAELQAVQIEHDQQTQVQATTRKPTPSFTWFSVLVSPSWASHACSLTRGLPPLTVGH